MTPLALLAACLALCGGQDPPPARADLPVSVEHIQERLQRAPALEMPVEPDFRASVTEEFTRPETVLEALRRELGSDRRVTVVPGTIAPALASVDLLGPAMQLKHRIGAALRARAERIARAKVEEALARFCASHDCSTLEPDLDESTPEGVLTR